MVKNIPAWKLRKRCGRNEKFYMKFSVAPQWRTWPIIEAIPQEKANPDHCACRSYSHWGDRPVFPKKEDSSTPMGACCRLNTLLGLGI